MLAHRCFLYGIRIVGFNARKGPIIGALKASRPAPVSKINNPPRSCPVSHPSCWQLRVRSRLRSTGGTVSQRPVLPWASSLLAEMAATRRRQPSSSFPALASSALCLTFRDRRVITLNLVMFCVEDIQKTPGHHGTVSGNYLQLSFVSTYL